VDLNVIILFVLAGAAYFGVWSLSRRVARVENLVVKLQAQVTDLRYPPASAVGSTAAPEASPSIDIEPFVE
jgi:hypothetical protein